MRKAHFKNWYGGSCSEVEKLISYFNQILEEGTDREKLAQILQLKPVALISPHAGWIYSGFTANFGYRILANSAEEADRVVVIGPSHRFPFKGGSVTLEEEYETPCGNLPIDREFSLELMERFNLKNLEYVHTEHSTEVQMPFIYHYLRLPVVEIVYSDYSPQEVAGIIDYSVQSNSLVVISTDLSHYYPLEIATKLDYFCVEGVVELNRELLKRCEACGKIGVEGIVEVARRREWTPLLVDYRTSADINRDKSQVVGYMSAIFLPSRREE